MAIELKINHPLLNLAYKVAEAAAKVTGNPQLEKKVKDAEVQINQRVDQREAKLPEWAQRRLYDFGEFGKKLGL